MKSLAPLTTFLRFTPSSPPFLSSHLLLLYPTTSRSFSSQNDDLSRNVKVSVWWDFENCNVPNGLNAVRVSKNIVSALRVNGIKGPVTITAFGDFIQLSKSTQEALSCTGVLLNHVPNGGKNTADRSLLADLVFWVSQNPPPAHIFLISTDKDFANILHRLRMNNYNILLACNDNAPGVLCSAASIKWSWYDLVKKENFSGKHFNEPPDGTWESWYCHNRGSLEDPFADMGQPICVQAKESTESATASKPQVIPKAIVNQIRHIVNSYPEGLAISDLRARLGKNNVSKNFFGYKKFSLLLKSLPTILKLKSSGDHIVVHGIQPKAAKPSGQQKVAERVHGIQPKAAKPGGQPKVAEQVDFEARKHTNLEAYDGVGSRIVTADLSETKDVGTPDVNKNSPLPTHSPPKTDHPPICPKENEVLFKEGHPSPKDHKDSISEIGFYQRAWRIIFGSESDASNSKSNNYTKRCSTTFDSLERKEPEQKSNESILEEKTRIKSEERNKTNPRVGMFSNIVKWYKSWKTGKIPDNTVGSFDKEMNQVSNQAVTNQLFSRASFWEDMLSFLHTSKSASVISQSTTRDELGQMLQKEGPSHLNTFTTGDLGRLVNLLIAEKKWVEESISKTFPFKLINSARASSLPSSTNESSYMFLEKLSQSNLQRPPSHETGVRKKKDTHHEACSNESDKKPFGKSKNKILADCRMLVDELFKEHPEEFNMDKFRISFHERYGYDLDYQKLGYWRLSCLLETIPGADVNFNFVLPQERSSKIVTPYNSQIDGAVKVSNSDSDDTMLYERSPISETKSKTNCLRPGIIGENTDGVEHKDYDDSYLLEGFSELEEEFPIRDGSDGENLANNNDDAVTVSNQDSNSIWKERLPTSKTKSQNNCIRSEIISEKSEGNERANFDDNSCLLDEFSELGEKFPKKDASDAKCRASKNEEESSLLRLLDSYYSKKNECIKQRLDN